jgi:beta-glucosidase
VVQLYLSDIESSVKVPLRQLVGFTRVFFGTGETRHVSFVVTARQMALIDAEGRRILEPGRFRLIIGGHQPDARSGDLTSSGLLDETFEVTGKREELTY